MAPTDIDGTVDALIGRMPLEHFDREIRERQPHRFQSAFDEAGVERLFNLNRLERLLEDECLLPCVDIYADGHLKRLADMQHKSGMSGLGVAARSFREGQTVRVRDVDRFDQTLSGFVASVQKRFVAHAQANVYLTPPHAEGFPPHFDITDVFVVQVLGAKDWNVFSDYGNRTELPLRSTDWDPERFEPGDDYEEMTLRTGDVLYLPRGTMHSAACDERESMHLTISLAPLTYADVLLQAVESAAANDVELRRRVPFPNGGSDAEMARLAETARDRNLEAMGHVDVLEHLRQERELLIGNETPGQAGALDSAIAELLSASGRTTHEESG